LCYPSVIGLQLQRDFVLADESTMTGIKQFFVDVWTYKVSLAPVLVTYLLFDAQAIYRRATKTWYVPIYFIVFPYGHSDKLYAEYFSEDDFYGVGTMTAAEKRSLRQKIIVYAILSMIFATIVAPYLRGLISALYLSRQQFIEFLVTIMVVKTGFIVYALNNIRNTSRVVNQGSPFYYVVAIYVAYLYFIWRGLTKSFEWASGHIEKAGAWGLLNAVGDIVHEEFFINIVAVGLLTWVVQQRLTLPGNISPLPQDSELEDGETSEPTGSAPGTRTLQ
jgi:hypothetical protein